MGKRPCPYLPDQQSESQQIWFYFYGSDESDTHDFYRLELGSDDRGKKPLVVRRRRFEEEEEVYAALPVRYRSLGTLNPISVADLGYSNFSSVGPFIVTAGAGLIGPANPNLYCLDTRDSALKWKLYQMITPRDLTLMAAIDGKLYIFGGLPTKDGLPCPGNDKWGEVFDPVQGSFEELQCGAIRSYMRDVPQYITAVDKQKKIVFCSSDTSDFAAYNVAKRTWTFWKDAKFSSHWSTLCLHGPKNPTVVGETMYWYASRMRLYAYDLRRHQWFLSKRGIWDGYEKECGKPVDSAPYLLLHLGGKLFCILWTHSPSLKNKHGRWSVPVCCTKLLIRKDHHTSTLKVSMFSTQVCRIPTRLGVVEAFLLKDLIQQTKSGRLGDGKEVAHKKTGKFDSRLS